MFDAEVTTSTVLDTLDPVVNRRYQCVTDRILPKDDRFSERAGEHVK
ncbi:MAG: hypothetical protein ACI8TP_003674 [Acidimicrobiales bacterium]|jgi:hypothetical protein